MGLAGEWAAAGEAAGQALAAAAAGQATAAMAGLAVAAPAGGGVGDRGEAAGSGRGQDGSLVGVGAAWRGAASSWRTVAGIRGMGRGEGECAEARIGGPPGTASIPERWSVELRCTWVLGGWKPWRCHCQCTSSRRIENQAGRDAQPNGYLRESWKKRNLETWQ